MRSPNKSGSLWTAGRKGSYSCFPGPPHGSPLVQQLSAMVQWEEGMEDRAVCLEIVSQFITLFLALLNHYKCGICGLYVFGFCILFFSNFFSLHFYECTLHS